MRIIVPTRRVPDLVEELVVNDAGNAIDMDEVDFKLNEFDEHALEEALCIKETSGGHVTVLSLEGDGVEKSLYTAIAKGADRAILLEGPDPEDIAGNHAVARAFAQALGDLEYDVVMTGVQGCDDRDGQLGPLLAAMLGLPCVSVATEVRAGGGAVTLSKEYSGGMMARYEVSLPAVIGVQAARQTPRYAPVSKVRQVQKTCSLDTIEVDDDLPVLSSAVAMAPPESGDGATMLDGVDALLTLLEEKGVA